MSDLSEVRALYQSLPPELRATILESAERGLEALRKPEDISLPRWAHRHFYLSAESSQREEEWKAWPFQIGLLACMGDDNITEFTFFKSARLGYTKCLLANIGYTAQHKRRNQCVWQPTDKDSDDFCKTDLEPMLRDVTKMRDVFPQVMAKSKANTLQQKKFLGSLLKLRGGNAAGNYRRLTLALATADELDGFEQSVVGAGTPDTLIKKRVEGATYPKCIWGSTGRKRGLSHIERLYKAMDVRMRFQITCPHCNVDHPLEWGGPKVKYGIKWDKLDPQGTVRHHCQHCYEPITQADYLRLARVGAWVSDCGTYRLRHWWDDKGEPCYEWTLADGTRCLPPKRVGMHCWTAYSEAPGVTWGQVVQEFLDANVAKKTGDRAPMVQWINETKGETFEEEGDKADVSALHTRAKASPTVMRLVPFGPAILVASVDVQDDRFEIMVWAVGRSEEVWVVDYIVMDVNPALMADWDRLWVRLQEQYRHASGAWMSIAGACVDTGGHFTHQAYSFVHKYQDRSSRFRLFAIKGSSEDAQPIKARSAKFMDINAFGRQIKKGVKLWHVGTDTAKDLFYGRIKVTQPGPGYVHFASDLPAEFFKQYGNEKRIPVKVNGRVSFRWVHVSGANEVVDLTVYCLFMIEALEISKFSERRWQQLESQLVPDLFDSEPPPNPTAPPTAAASAPAPQLPAPEPGQAIQPGTRSIPERPQPVARKKPTAPPPSDFGSSAWRSRL